MTSPSLPDKLSDLLELALNDLSKLEADPNLTPNMSIWCNGCSACLAGAVMIFSLNANPKDFTTPTADFPEVIHKLYAINFARLGNIRVALKLMNQKPMVEFGNQLFVMPVYENDPAYFRKRMNVMIVMLRINDR